MLIILISLTVLLVAAGSGFLLWRRSRRRKLFRKLEPDLFRSSRYELKSIDQFLYDRCCRYMTEKKPFLVCSFTLGDLASALYSNKVYLSKTINHFSGRNFRQYVNYYRVMYSMELFRNNMTLKVSDLSNLSGFHSSTTFTQAFQNVMGKTPSAWCWEMRRSGRTGKK